MKNINSIVRILAKGGILTPRYMQKVCSVAKKCGNKTISFGSRQDILFRVPRGQELFVSQMLLNNNIPFEWKRESGETSQNIVSSYVANDILKSTAWVNSGTYIEVLEVFDYLPKVQINIVDPKQKLVPLFSGNLNFVASELDNYWFLFIKKKNDPQLYEWPVLIYGAQIALVSSFLEPYLLKGVIDIVNLFDQMNKKLELTSINKKKNLETTSEFAPYYEGINKMEGRKDYWAGFYWRNNNYTIEFIESVCDLCFKTKIAKISITPWKSFLVKNIKEIDLIYWEQLIGYFGINMRHSSFDLFWHLPYGSNRAFKLKKYIVNQLDKVDIRTYGLTFSINWPEIPFTTIIINRKPILFGLFSQYEIWHARNFNAETHQYILFAGGLKKYELTQKLISLSKKFYQKIEISSKKAVSNTNNETEKIQVSQCGDCQQIYVDELGDELSDIEPKTPFEKLPDAYCCPTCGSGKGVFNRIEINREMIFPN
jgi:rubredoxin